MQIIRLQMYLQQVLACFKQLHKVRKQVFQGDTEALTAGREKINEEFRKNKDVIEENKITELLKFGDSASTYLKTMVVQAKWSDDKEVYEVKITKDTYIPDNTKFKITEDKT